MALTVKHRVSLDLSLGAAQATVPFRRGDGAAHEVIFSLRYGSEPIELPVGTVAVITVLNGADGGAGVADMCVVDHVSGTVSYSPTKSALSVAGNIACELEIVGAGGERLGAPRFIFFVDDTMLDVSEREITKALEASTSWGVIQSTKHNAEDAAASKEAAAKSERAAAESERAASLWAIGRYHEGGVVIPADEDDPQYGKSAQHFAQKAENSAKAANASAKLADRFLVFEMDETSYVLTAKLVNSEGTVFTSTSVDLPLESMVVGIEDTYDDDVGTSVRFVLKNGGYSDWFTLDDIIGGFVTKSELAYELEQVANSISNFGESIHNDIGELARVVYENSDEINAHEKRIKLLEGRGVFTTDDSVSSEKTVPVRAEGDAIINRIGGSGKSGVKADVAVIKSMGANILKPTFVDKTVNGVTFTMREDGGVLMTGPAAPSAASVNYCKMNASSPDWIFTPDALVNISLQGSFHNAQIQIRFYNSDTAQDSANQIGDVIRLSEKDGTEVNISMTDYPGARSAAVILVVSTNLLANELVYVMCVRGRFSAPYRKYVDGPIDTYTIPSLADKLAAYGYGHNYIDLNEELYVQVEDENGKSVSPEKATWVGDRLAENYIKVEGGGSLVFEDRDGNIVDAYSSITYQEGRYET